MVLVWRISNFGRFSKVVASSRLSLLLPGHCGLDFMLNDTKNIGDGSSVEIAQVKILRLCVEGE